jgi:hypothetical protein
MTSSTGSQNKQQDGNKERMPPTPLELLKDQYRNSTTDNATESTSSNSVSGRSRQSMQSASSARFIELKARITRQQTEFDRQEKISSDRLSQIERQFHRFDEVESKLDNLKTTLTLKLMDHKRHKRLNFKP